MSAPRDGMREAPGLLTYTRDLSLLWIVLLFAALCILSCYITGCENTSCKDRGGRLVRTGEVGVFMYVGSVLMIVPQPIYECVGARAEAY